MEEGEGRRPNSRPPMDVQPTNSIYIGNLLFEATPQDLEREFSAYGEIVSSKVAQDARGLSKGYVITLPPIPYTWEYIK
jgi:RNA recognition motif-containing protein